MASAASRPGPSVSTVKTEEDEFPEWTEEELNESAPESSDFFFESERSPPPEENPPLSAEPPASSSAVDAGAGGGFFAEDDLDFVCEECERPFVESWLMKNFNCKICDDCRDRDGKHSMVTKTDAKNEYLLKDEDFDVREPVLRCITKKNPHNSNWGSMRLYLRIQVEQRALEVWGTEEALDEEREKRQQKQTKSKKRTFDKMIKELRMNARSSLGIAVKANHEHVFGEEKYNKKKDVYSKKCEKCDHVMEYEKM